MFGCFTFPKLGCKTKQNKNIFYFFTTQKLGAVAADLLHKSVLGLCLIISRAARYLPKPALNKIPSLCVYNNLYGSAQEEAKGCFSKFTKFDPQEHIIGS